MKKYLSFVEKIFQLERERALAINWIQKINTSNKLTNYQINKLPNYQINKVTNQQTNKLTTTKINS